MTADREALRQDYPAAFQLLMCFGPDYDYEYDKDERTAVEDYINGRGGGLAKTIRDLDALLARFTDDADLRAALLAIGVKWTIWDRGNDWRPFVLRLRQWLVESLPQEPESSGSPG